MPVRVSGIGLMLSQLSALADQATVDSIVRESLHEGAEVVQEEMVASAPVRTTAKTPNDTGLAVEKLKENIEIVPSDPSDNIISETIRPNSKVAHVALWLEYGHRLVRGGKSRRGKRGWTGKGQQIGEVDPHPFMRQAWDISTPAARDTVTGIIRTKLKQLLQR